MLKPLVLKEIVTYEATCPYCSFVWRTRNTKAPRACTSCKKYFGGYIVIKKNEVERNVSPT